jgi:plastocyanin
MAHHIPRLTQILVLLALTGVIGACAGNMAEGEGTGTTQQPVNEPVTVVVNVRGNHFDPQSLTIPVGSTVVWENDSGVEHHLECDLFDAALNPGQEFSFTFDRTGTWTVINSDYPEVDAMRVRIHVE